MFEKIKEVVASKEEYHCLPAPFQKGTESNKDLTKFNGALLLTAFVMYGIGHGINFLCNIDNQYNKYRQAHS